MHFSYFGFQVSSTKLKPKLMESKLGNAFWLKDEKLGIAFLIKEYQLQIS